MTADTDRIDWNALHLVTELDEIDAHYFADLNAYYLASMADVIDSETRSLADGKIDEALALLDMKQERSVDYMRSCELVRRNLVAMTRLVPERLADLKSQQQELLDRLNANAKLIAMIRSLSENFLRGIAHNTQSNSKLSTYGQNGRESRPAPRAPAQAIIVSTTM